MVNVEPAFPRGQYKPQQDVKNRVKKPKTSKKYGATILPEEKAFRLRPEERRKLKLSENRYEDTEDQQSLDASNLTVSMISTGMLVLGCVKRINKTDMELSFPGRIKGSVPISKISDAYSKRLQQMVNFESAYCPSLNDLYSVGDMVYAKLTEKKISGTLQLFFSLKPTDLHSQYVNSQLVAGLILVASIVEKEDHGYTMDIGIHNVRAFLSDKNLGQNRDDIGRNLFCSIESVSQHGTGATVLLKALDPDAPRVLDVEQVDLGMVVPGCKLMFTVGEPVKFGLQGMLFDDTVPAFVNETMLTKVTSTPKKYSMFKKLPATLLYVIPSTNQIFVSLRPYPNNRVEIYETYRHGATIEKAFVKAIDGIGVWFQFQNKHRALLLRKFIIKRAESLGRFDESVVMGKYQIDTAHKLSIIYHDPLEDTYIVSDDPSHVDEMIMTPNDIVIGNIYKCHVLNIVEQGAHVRVGNVRGSLFYEYYDRSHPVKPNDTILVRAVYREPGNGYVKFTNHPAFLDEKASILYEWEQLDATKDEQTFLGVISRILDNNNIIVRFFNGITAKMDNPYRNPKCDFARIAKLREGTVEKFTVTNFENETKRIFLKLAPTEETIQSAVVVNAIVLYVHATGIDVRTEDGETGTIPSECFSEFGEHNSLYMRLLQEGTTLTVVRTNPGTYSFRLVPYFKTHPMNIESVRRGALLKGNCITVNGVLYVTPLLSNFSQRYEIKMKENYRKVEDGSVMMMHVLNVKNKSEKDYTMDVSTALDVVAGNGIDDVYHFMMEYFKDVKALIERYQEEKYPFANYTIGQHVECVVESIVPESNKIAIEVHAINKQSKHAAAKGIATIVLPDKPASLYKVGQKVPGRVVWIDVERKLVHVCLDKPLFERIAPLDANTKVQKSKVQQPAWVLFANKYVQICCFQSGPQSTLLIVPVKHHYNDMVNSTNNDTNSLQVRTIKRLGPMMFAVQEQALYFYNSCQAQASVANMGPTEMLVSYRQLSETFDETSMLEEDETDVTDESENESVDEAPIKVGKRTGNAEDDNDQDETANNMDDDEDYDNDKSSGPTPSAMGTSKQRKKGSTSKPSKNGNYKPILKRKILAEAEESAPEKQLPLKKKKQKKKSSPVEVLETATTVAKVPKTGSKKTKKSLLLIGKKEKSKKSKLKKKIAA
ncbi:protein RRP5 homolog isoform X2 [Anopheles funestus]|uniref:protein RRP5 homolog isoform X2 n=1 Tax=Anopheles funestus TaxID=62324 RepID=UPI0020C5E494|nr:protein RRP5 homolog isoform X2 [Anopheles funestus]